MIPENQHFDRKSLRKVTGKTAAWAELALDCVAFANAQGSRLLRVRGQPLCATARPNRTRRVGRDGGHPGRNC